MKVLLMILIFNVFVAVIGFLSKSLINEELRWPLFFIFLIFTFFIISRVMALRVFQFENMGDFFSIRYYSPLKKEEATPFVKYPVSELQTFKTEKLSSQDFLIMELRTEEKENPERIKIRISDISDNDIRLMVNSFITG